MVGIDARGKGLSNVENDLSVVRGQRHLGTMMPFERFKAWQVGHRLALDVYTASEGWPARERYGLVSQIRRAALSIPSNIAEGSAKRGHREFGRHLDIALGSLSELTYCCGCAWISNTSPSSSGWRSKQLELKLASSSGACVGECGHDESRDCQPDADGHVSPSQPFLCPLVVRPVCLTDFPHFIFPPFRLSAFPSSRWPGEFPTAEDVEVQVVDALAGIGPGIGHDPVALGVQA